MVMGWCKSPLRIPKNKRGDLWSLNSNNRNTTHFQAYNKLKISYGILMSSEIECLPTFRRVRVTFTIYPVDRRKFDIDNVGAIQAKFFLDALVKSGKLPEDNYTCVPELVYKFGEVDKTDPRCEICIEELCVNTDKEPS